MTIVPVLLYHRVSHAPGDPFAVSPMRFRDHVAAIAASGRTPMTISKLAAGLRGAAPLPERPVAVTFDDGYQDTVAASEVLAAADLSCTVYVTTGAVGRGDAITPGQVQRLAAAPTVELGAHTVSHQRLDELSERQAFSEIHDSKQALQELTGQAIDTFAYPHGAYDAVSRRLVIEAGFGGAAAVKNALSHAADDPWAIARWSVMGSTLTGQLAAFLDARDAPLAWTRERIRTRAYRSVRRARRRVSSVAGRASLPRARTQRAASAQATRLAPAPEVDVTEAPLAVCSVDLSADVPRLAVGRPRRGGEYRRAAVLLRRGRQPLGWTTVDVLEAGRLDLAPLAEDVPARLIAKPSAPRRLAGPASGRFTAVCTTCAAADDAVRCVRMLRERGGPDLEIIVVENRPQRSSVQAALCTAFPNDPRLRYLEEARPGLSHARNAGLHAATGDYVAFIDDDVTVDENWLDSLQAAVANAPDAACITGPIFPSELETEAQVVLEHFATFSKGLDRRRYSLAGPDTAPLFPYAAGHFGSGANMTFRADALRRAGGFDVKLGTGTRARGGEDLDICVRLIQAGEALVYEPGVIVWHRHPDGIKRVRAQAHAYGVGLGAMLAKHLLFGPSRFELLKLMPHGARYLLSPGSRKNAAKRAGYPASLNLAERAGLLIGPLAYVASRLSSDDPPAAPAAESQPPAAPRAGCRRLWSGEFEWTAPVLPEPPLLTSGGEPFDHARLLIRVHGEPVGFVQVPIEQGYLQPAAVTAAARRAYAGRIDRHLAALDAIAAPSVAQPRWQPTVSIVVCTRDRPERLRRCLAALSQLEYEHREVIVVDNAPAGGPTAALVAEAAAGDPRVRYVREPRPGLSRARNKGLREARGELIAFTDDDVRVDAMWLAGILRGFGRGSDVACVTGLVASASLEQASERFFDERVSWASSCEARVYGRDDGDQGSKLYPYAAGMFGTGANMALRTRVARALGGFDECLGAGSPTSGGEDLDMFVRVLRSGHALSYEPAALVWHDHRVRAQDLERQMYGYGKGLAAFLCKYLFSRSSGPDVARRAAHGASHFVGLGRRSEAVGAREGLSVSLRRAELRGVLAGPPAYLRARRRANRQHLRAVAPR